MEKTKELYIKLNKNIENKKLIFPTTPPILIPIIKRPNKFTFDISEYQSLKTNSLLKWNYHLQVFE